jgi:L-aminopeptidase/D-esterase-like protein
LKMRARDLGIRFEGEPGALNAITDVPGLEVGMVTLISGEGDLVPDAGPVRTGVTAILPVGKTNTQNAIPAGIYSLNGNGEMTGSHWINETGGLSGPIMITNTHAVGTVHRGVIEWVKQNFPEAAMEWLLPVVAETWDGYLNDINGAHVTTEHAISAINTASGGEVSEGSHGGGTGMNCYGFKGGNGTASRTVPFGGKDYVVGVFVQANFGDRKELRIQGVDMSDLDVPNPMDESTWMDRDKSRTVPGGAGSVIVIVATNAPLLPDQCRALARRVPLGLARTGTAGGHFSGDIFLAVSTAQLGELSSGFPTKSRQEAELKSLDFVPWNYLDAFYTAVVQGVEESVLNALVNNTTMVGRDGNTSYALPHDQVISRISKP